MVRRVLMIAFHYPPYQGSSGLLRTLKFSQYLPECDWVPIILTAHPRAYLQTQTHQLKDIPPQVHVERAFALDTVSHLSIGGRYPGFFALPDRWATWWFGAVTAGMQLIRQHKPDVIWSTYPIATAHLIGFTLAKLSGLPWVADFRDSMTEDNYPVDPRTRKVYRWIERKTVHRAQRITFTAPSTVSMYADRYPNVDTNHWKLIYNGYDDADFDHLKPAKNVHNTQKLLVHAGILYPNERDPRPFFQALARLKSQGLFGPDTLKVRLRATAYDDYYLPLLHEHGIDDIVELAPALLYADALQEMSEADGLLLFQAANCNHQIPAKLYEYMRAGQPILALTDRAGDTAKILIDNALDTIAALDNVDEIEETLSTFLEQINQGNAPTATQASWEKFSRRAQTQELAELLNHLTEDP